MECTGEKSYENIKCSLHTLPDGLSEMFHIMSGEGYKAFIC